MRYSQLEKISNQIARQVLIDYTKEELLTPEQANLLKQCMIDNIQVYLSQFTSDDDLIP